MEIQLFRKVREHHRFGDEHDAAQSFNMSVAAVRLHASCRGAGGAARRSGSTSAPLLPMPPIRSSQRSTRRRLLNSQRVGNWNAVSRKTARASRERLAILKEKMECK